MEKKTKKPFFAKHAKSSAMLVSIAIHAIIVLVAITFVAFTVVLKEEKTFVAKDVKRPKMKLKKLQVPVKIEKRRKQTAKLRKRVVAKKARKTSAIQMPEITGVLGGMGAMNVASGIGTDIGFTMPEINFFGAKQRSEKVVFIVLAGSASTRGSNGKESPKSRMIFHTLRARLEDMIDDLPDYALFNVAFFQLSLTTPFSTNMVLATEDNKDLLKEWASTVNPLDMEETYGPGDPYEGFWDRFKALDWSKGEKMTENVPPVYPKWLYHYSPGPEIMKHYRGTSRDEREFIHWNRAVCFAFEQKPDTIFILTTNYIGEEPGDLNAALQDICNDIYGPDRQKWPTLNVVILSRPGRNVDFQRDRYVPIVNSFGGVIETINDIRDHMTPEELAELDKMEGVL
jgi:hypothetical protein